MLPKRHEFTYPLFLVFLDIDRIPELMRISPITSYNRANVVSYRETDHFGNPSQSLRERVERQATHQSIAPPQGKIFLLTHLRYFGYNFNPVSFFYCYTQNGKLSSVLAEVNNTFAETHNYWLTAEREVPAGTSKRYRFAKAFHVSPFLEMRQHYDWTFTAPGNCLTVQCMNFEDESLVFDSTLKLERRDWTARELHRAVARFPFLTLKVIAAIHWQGLRLLLKRTRVVHHPGAGQFTPSPARNFGASWKPE
jgi:hypothetical protein